MAVLRFDLQGVDSAKQLAERMEQHTQLRRTRTEDWVSMLLQNWKPEDPWDSLEALLNRAPAKCVVMFDEVLAVTPFGTELAHLGRHGHPVHLRHALDLASVTGANRNSVLAGLQTRLSRSYALNAMEALRQTFFLDASDRIALPLLALARRRKG